MQGFDVFCFPSLFEGLAVAYIEAAVSGVPIIISNGVPYIKTDIEIFRIELDRDKWINKISIISNSESNRSETNIEGLRNDYDIKKLAENLQTYYCNLVCKYE